MLPFCDLKPDKQWNLNILYDIHLGLLLNPYTELMLIKHIFLFQSTKKNEDMKLKERVVAATFGFSLAIILVFLLESLELTNHERRAIPQDQSHGIINSQNVASASKTSSKTSSIKAFKQRNLQKTDSSGQHSEQNQLVNSAPMEGHQKTRLSENVHGEKVRRRVL